MTRPARAVVVGAGIAGLVAARELALAGREVHVFESSDHIGGAVRGLKLGGVRVDVGAEAYSIARPECQQLIEDLGIAGQVIYPRRSDAHLLLRDGMFDIPPGLLGIPADLSTPQVAAVLGDDGCDRARELDALPVVADIDDGVSLGQLVRMRMGDAVVERLVSPVVGGVHAIDPDKAEAEAVIPGVLAAMRRSGSLAGAAQAIRGPHAHAGAAVAGLAGGMSRLVEALASDIAARGGVINSGTPVTAVEFVCEPLVSREWVLRTADGPVHADEVVLAVDAASASALLVNMPDPSAALSAIKRGDVAVVVALVDDVRLDEDPVGSGLLIAPSCPGVHAKALTHVTAKWDWVRAAYGPGRHLVRLSYGRDGQLDLDRIGVQAEADLAEVFGERVRLRDLAAVRWSTSLVQPVLGHTAALAAARACIARVPTLALVGAGIGGNGLAGTIATSRGVVTQLDQGELRP